MHRVVVLVSIVLLAAACGDGPEKRGRAPRDIPHVYTTFYPTTYFVERIGGDKVKAICPLPDGKDPIFWRPSADVIAQYQDDADVIVVNGATFEKWVRRRALPRSRVVDTLKGHEKLFIKYRNPVKHTHGGKEHVHKDIDGHTWIDPTMAVLQVDSIHKALVSRYPQHADTYGAGHEALAGDLRALDAGFKELGKLADGMWIYAAHPAYAYLGRTYGWRFVNLDLDPQRVPTAEELEVIRKKLAIKEGRYLWWDQAPAADVAATIKKETGLESVVFTLCTSPPSTGDYLSVMKENLERARPAFAK